jgi:hypothetical protein
VSHNKIKFCILWRIIATCFFSAAENLETSVTQTLEQIKENECNFCAGDSADHANEAAATIALEMERITNFLKKIE